jgi:hypothetical protein
MYNLLGNLIVILITIGLLRKLGKLAVSKQAAQYLEGARFNHRKLSELEFRKQYQTLIAIRFAALENLNCNEYIDTVWENIKENNKTTAK